MKHGLVTRIAPTPSGFLHSGNVFNFLLTWAIARRNHGKIILRIDDGDLDRCKIEYVENIFKTIDLLGIDYDLGPQGVDDYLKNFRQIDRREFYRFKLETMIKNGLLIYKCDCSRQAIKKRASYPDNYDGFCLTRQQILADSLSNNFVYRINNQNHFLKMNHFVIWQKCDLPSYQLTSIVDDIEMKVDLIVRGSDLIPSTEAQFYLANFLDSDFLANVKVIHHKLITDSTGNKLSKSKLALKFDQSNLQEIVKAVGIELGLSVEPSNLAELVTIK